MKKLSTQLTAVVAGTALFAAMGLAQAQSSTNSSGSSGMYGATPSAQGTGSSGSMPAAGESSGSSTGSRSSDNANANVTTPGSAINQNQETMRSGTTTLTEEDRARTQRDQSATGSMNGDRPTRTARADRN